MGYAPTGIQFTPQVQFDAPAMYEATVGYVTNYCGRPVVTYTWTFEMACLFDDTLSDEAIDVVSCNGQQFALSTDEIDPPWHGGCQRIRLFQISQILNR